MGPKEFHTLEAPGSVVEPAKNARYVDQNVNDPSAVRFHQNTSYSLLVGDQ
jgi:hypothetical protein